MNVNAIPSRQVTIIDLCFCGKIVGQNKMSDSTLIFASILLLRKLENEISVLLQLVT